MDAEKLQQALEWAECGECFPGCGDCNCRNAASVLRELAGEIEAYRQAVSHVTEEPSADRSFTTRGWTMTSAQRHTDMLCEIERLKAENERMRKVVEAAELLCEYLDASVEESNCAELELIRRRELKTSISALKGD